MSDDLLLQGVDLMLYGMGTVFIFLILLVFIIGYMSRIITRYLPEIVPPKKMPLSTPDPVVPVSHLAAIQKALELHRKSTHSD